MKLFLVRHGEGENFQTHWQSPDTPLSQKGKKQAEAVISTHRFKDIEIIYSSNQKRSTETAEIIAKGFNKEFKVIDGIEERHQPSEIYGLIRTDLKAEKYLNELINTKNRWEYKWNSEDESFKELLERAVKFKKYLLKNNLEKNVLVVSHEAFIKCFILACVLGEKTDKDILLKLVRSLKVENTGISLLIFNPDTKNWKIWYINDYAHL